MPITSSSPQDHHNVISQYSGSLPERKYSVERLIGRCVVPWELHITSNISIKAGQVFIIHTTPFSMKCWCQACDSILTYCHIQGESAGKVTLIRPQGIVISLYEPAVELFIHHDIQANELKRSRRSDDLLAACTGRHTGRHTDRHTDRHTGVIIAYNSRLVTSVPQWTPTMTVGG